MMEKYLILVFSLMVLLGCEKIGWKQNLKFQTDYQAVFLDNGQVFFGKLENAGSDYPLLREVFYVQSQANPETKEVKSILIKRGNEWHGPDIMHINSRHIMLIEPVGTDSRVAQLIKDAKAKEGK